MQNRSKVPAVAGIGLAFALTLLGACSPSAADLAPFVRGHGAWVNAIAVSPDDSRALSSSEQDGTKYWDIGSQKELAHFNSHKIQNLYATYDVAFTPDGVSAVTCGQDGVVEIWNLGTGASVRRLDKHPWGVNRVSVSQKGDRLLSAAQGGRLNLWERETGSLLCNLVGHESAYGLTKVAFASDGKTAVSASQDRSVRTWDLSNCSQLSAVQGKAYVGGPVAFSVERGVAASRGKDHRSVITWEIASGRELQRMVRHTGEVHAIALSPDSQRIISGGEDKRLVVWNFASGKVEFERTLPTEITAIAVSNSGSWVLAGGKDGAIYRISIL